MAQIILLHFMIFFFRKNMPFSMCKIFIFTHKSSKNVIFSITIKHLFFYKII
uniref:Uncharacterized protein n=1 Tax=Solanum lycopersicum TaxID=4081 RepID=A0A3Q7FAW0_SOLLC